LFAFAGIFTGRPERPDDASYAIITTSPNELVAQVHSRMPMILDPADEGLWLDATVTDPIDVIACLRPYPAQQMEAYPVGPLVSSAWNEGSGLIEPVGISQGRLWSLELIAPAAPGRRALWAILAPWASQA